MGSMIRAKENSIRSSRFGISEIGQEDSSRYRSHGLFPYPAMMVPRLQGELMDYLLKTVPEDGSVYDPFMGSGTVLSEALSRGRDFYGTDVNPLSLLCCKVKADEFELEEASHFFTRLARELQCRRAPTTSEKFPGAEKWFPEEVLNTLHYIREKVKSIDSPWCRRIFWLALAECARKFSRTRLSTYKLHIDKSYNTPSSDEVVHHFLELCERNIKLKDESWSELRGKGFLHNNSPISEVSLERADARCSSSDFLADLVVTSPPYGDNQTTVTYGQFSYLPLQFIDFDDIENGFDWSLLENANRIDSVSLGGSQRFWKEKLVEVECNSVVLRHSLKELKDIGRGGEKRLAVFSYDLYQSLVKVSQRLRYGGSWMMTLGNREINGMPVPLDQIVSDFLHGLGFEDVAVLDRKISKKRMAGSMRNEKIVVMKKLDKVEPR